MNDEKYLVYVDIAVLEDDAIVGYVWNGAPVELEFDDFDAARICYEHSEGVLTDSFLSTVKAYLGHDGRQLMPLVSIDDYDGNHLSWVGKMA